MTNNPPLEDFRWVDLRDFTEDPDNDPNALPIVTRAFHLEQAGFAFVLEDLVDCDMGQRQLTDCRIILPDHSSITSGEIEIYFKTHPLQIGNSRQRIFLDALEYFGAYQQYG